MEQTIKILIYFHAFFGGLGLITGILSIYAKKGSIFHKSMGKLFSIGMITSSLISLPVSWMPNHENLFLFLIGIFTIYMVLIGNRALKFKSKKKQKAGKTDYIISISMLLFSVLMVFIGIYGITSGNNNNILFIVFGGTGLFMSFRDLKFYKSFLNVKNMWLKNHIGKMVGAFIASVTAFIVAGIGIGNLIAWILPSVIGTLYIVYWMRKVKTIPQRN